jgi:lipoprotein-anchoring transpeptidase ErfK/SrfK
MMAVGLWRRVLVLGATVAVAATLAACSTATQAAGRGGAGTGTAAPSAPANGSAGPATSPGTTSSGAPITVVAPPSGQADPSTSAVTDPADPTTSDPTTAPTTLAPPPAPAATVTGSPTFGSTGIAPAGDLTITAKGGTLSWLTFTNPDGKKVKGSLSKDHTRWTLGEPLGFGKTYTVAGVAVNADGVQTKVDATYVTATTVEPVTTTISPGSGAVVGVAAPVIVRFGMDPQDKALVEKHVKITSTPKVKGSWAWITHDGDTYPSLDFRPEKYWPAGTKVHVESDIYGVKFADGWYGGNSQSVDFTIGRNQVVIANAKTHRMTVKRDGKTVWTFDASMGMGDDPNSEYGLNKDLVTRSGIHVVMNKHAVYKMSNPKYHYQDVPEYWAVRISNNGEFIHNNPGTTAWELANVNKTHGCINLSWDDAKAYFESAIYGDPVEVIGTSVKLSPSDGDIYDWAIPWSTWQTMSALAKNSIVD